MNIKIDTVHFDADKKLIEFIEKKINKVAKKSSDIISADVILRLDKSDTNENKITEIRLEVPGNDLFAKKQAKTFEEGVDTALSALEKQIERYKNKR
jgi:putative sigma-54 modulation protein